MHDDSRRIVRQGYDRISFAYRPNTPDEAIANEYASWLDWIFEAVPAGSQVLDLGCGCGIPAAKLLVERGYSLVGVDISHVQIERARELVPEATFHCGDMTALAFAPETFDAIVSLYSIIHVPVDEQLPLIRRIAKWVRPGGVVLAMVGNDAWTGTERDWLGVPGGTMYWSHADANTYREWFAECGLAIQKQLFVPDGDGGHILMFARREP